MASPSHTLRSATPVERWSLVNAALVLSASVAGLALGATWPVVAAGGAGLLGLVVLARKLWTPAGLFGRANTVTAGRLLLVLALPLLPADASPAWPIAAGLIVLVADGLDGWLARRYEMTSEFGEFFDKETDALFLLVLCFMTASRGLLTPWVVGLGLLRYVFVFALFLLQPHVGKEYRSSWARVIYVVAILSLLAAFLPFPAVVQPVVAGAATALIYSFGRYLWWVWSVREV